jgi:enterochelin esterase-like enzyme
MPPAPHPRRKLLATAIRTDRAMPITALLLAAALAPAQAWVKPYEAVKLPKTVQEFTTDLPATGEGRLWVEDNELKAIYRGDASFVNLSGGIQEPMARFEGTDYWGVQFHHRGWNRAIVSYSFIPQPRPKDFVPTTKQWKGENAPPIPQPTAELKGKMTQKTFKSDYLAQERTVSVYTPPGDMPNIPFIVMADGQGAETFARILEPLIEAGKVRPIAIVGIASGPYLGDAKEYQPEKDYRAREYLRHSDPKTFDNHLRWVIKEVIPWARKEFNLSDHPEDTGLFGFSNGGSFAAEAAVRYPDVFGVAFPFSAGFPPQESHITGKMAKFYFAAGSLESFSARTKQAYALVRKWRAEAEYEEYEAGHDMTMWQIAFLDVMQKAFPPQ